MSKMKMVKLFFILSLSFFYQIVLSQSRDKAYSFLNKRESAGFIENKGQITDQNGKTNSKVKFLLPLSAGLNVDLTATGFSYETYTTEIDTAEAGTVRKRRYSTDTLPHPATLHFHRVDVEFLQCNPSPDIIADSAFAYSYNFPGKGGRVRSYRRVTYKDLYPFIDLVFEQTSAGESALAEYYFIVRPGGHAEKIRWKYSGAYSTALKNNHIELKVEKGILQEHIPRSYLTSNLQNLLADDASGKNVQVAYSKLGNDIYGFKTDAYNPLQTLVIDPKPDLVWGTYYGGNIIAWAHDVSISKNGDLFVCGSSINSSNLATSGAYQTTMLGSKDVIIGKFDNNGRLQWMTYFGGTSEEDAEAICIDNAGDVVVAGHTFSDDHIATPGAYQAHKAGSFDVFLTKFDTNGNLIWSTFYGGENYEFGLDMATDVNNNIYVCGFTASTQGIATAGGFQPTYASDPPIEDANDGYIAKFSAAGSLVWGTYYGGASSDGCAGIVVDNKGSVFVAGETRSTNNISSPNAFKMVLGGGADVFIVKFTSAGNRVWSTYYGGTDYEIAEASIAIDSKGNVIVAGETVSTNGIATSGAYQSTYSGGLRDAFLVKFNNDGGLIGGTYFGGELEEFITALAIDNHDNIFITGNTNSSSHITTAGSYQTTMNGPGSIYISELDNNNRLLWGTYYGYGGPYGGGEGDGIVADTYGNVYVAGATTFTNNISTCGAQQENWIEQGDMFLAKFRPNTPSVTPSVNISADKENICAGTEVHFTANPQNVQEPYQINWIINEVVISTGVAFSTNQISDGDVVQCILSPNSACSVAGTDYTSNAVTIHISQDAVPAITISASSNTICTGESVDFTTSVVNEGDNPIYSWAINGVATGVQSNTFTGKNLADGDAVSCLLTRHNLCTSDVAIQSAPVIIHVKQIVKPTITIQADKDAVCSNTFISFKADVTESQNSSYQWMINGNATGTSSSVYTTNALRNGDKVECLLLTANTACASGSILSNAITETIFTTPSLSIIGDTIIAKGSSTQLQASTGGQLVSYQWSPANSLSNASIYNPVATPSSSTTYSLKVVSLEGCEAEKNITITVIYGISIPNAFSPNNDGTNDQFKILYGDDISHVRFRVYNRWGQLMFEDEGLHKGWDGKYKGLLQPTGSYVWMLEYKSNEGKTNILRGTVQLLQ